MRCVFTSAILIIGICTAYAQPKNDEIKPGINARQFLSATSGDNSLQTGQLSVNIPLFNLQGKGVDVPITLSFNAGNINHQSDASPVGLGWSLLAGGVITRTVRDHLDSLTASPNDVPWQYDPAYIQNKLAESGNNPYAGLMVQKLDYMIAFDKEPDVMNYSFLGFSGDIYNRRNIDGSYTRKISPNISFKIEDTSLGYKIIDDKGIEYFFEAKEKNGFNPTGYYATMSWFLTKIKTPQGGEVSFQYADENAFDPTDKLHGSPYLLVKSKRLTRIDYDYGYVTFGSAPREDMYYDGTGSDARRITTIELHDKGGSVVKGYELGNNGYMTEASTYPTWESKRMKLSTLKEYGANLQYNAPYEFDYNFYFYLNRASSQGEGFAMARNTWAHNPIFLYSVDRSQWGELVPHLVWYWDSDQQEYHYTIGGVTVTSDLIGGAVADYFCMTRMKFPSGGEESYSYEAHTYSYLGTYDDPEVANLFDGTQFIQGKRLRKKETKDNNGSTLISEYKYFDGILINPSIHNSTMYSSNRLHYDTPYLIASPHYTQEPQNGRTGSPIYYAKVEEDFLSAAGASNGKKIYYFEKMHSQPATNYLYANTTHLGENRLVNLPNVLGGKQLYSDPSQAISIMSNAYATYLAYPVGRFSESELSKGILLKELTYSAGGQLVKKTENEYNTNSLSSQTLFGYIVEKFDDTIYEPSYPNSHTYRYLISQMANTYGAFRQLNKTTTTHYFQTDSVNEEQKFTYNSKGLLGTTTSRNSSGGKKVTVLTYPTNYPSTPPYPQMVMNNIIAPVIEKTEYRDSVSAVNFLQSTMTHYAYWADGNATSTPNNQIYPQQVLSKRGNPANSYEPRSSITSYANDGKVREVREKADGPATSYLWGYNGQYQIAEAKNAKVNEIYHNNFEEATDYPNDPDGGVVKDNAVAHTGAYSGRITNANSGELYKSSNTWLQVSLGGVAKKFRYSGWVYSNGPSVELLLFMNRQGETGYFSYVDAVFTAETNKWVYLDKVITVPADVSKLNLRLDNNSAGSVWFDDLRIAPADAEMNTYTYKPLTGVTSTTDARGLTTYYEYDSLQRLVNVKDKDGNILKHTDYHYANQ